MNTTTIKTKLSLLPLNGGAFNCLPAREIELEDERICANHVILPWENNYHHTRLFVIGNEFGALGAVWADHEQDAFDELVDQNLGDGLLVPADDVSAMTDDERDELANLGNAGEFADLTHAWIQVVRLDETKDCRLMVRFAMARCEGAATLGNL